MRAVLQRADGAWVEVAGHRVGGFSGLGLVALVGVTHSDTSQTATALAAKIFGLRIFDAADANRRGRHLPEGSAREVSAADLDLPVLVVSQFTLYGDARKGRRPTWDAAAPREVAEPLVAAVATALASLGATVTCGQFGAEMDLHLTNTGPFTVLLEA